MSDKDYIAKLEKDNAQQHEKYNKLLESSHHKDQIILRFMELSVLKDKVFNSLDKRFRREFDDAEYHVSHDKESLISEVFDSDACMKILEKIELDRNNTIKYKLKRVFIDNIVCVLSVTLLLSPFIAWAWFAIR